MSGLTKKKRPAIKAKYGPQPYMKMLVSSSPWLRFARGPGKQFGRLTYTDEQLVVTVSNRLKMQNAAFERSKTAFGRLCNFILWEDAHYIEFTGVHLGQLFRGGGLTVPDAVKGGTTYLVRRDVVEECLAVLTSDD